MSTESVQAWKTDVAYLVVQEIPFQTLESGLTLAESYLAATGGWFPDDVSDPTGPGNPVSGETAPEAAETIKQTLLERIQDFTIEEANIRVKFHYVDNFSFCEEEGDDRQQSIDAMRIRFKDFIEFQLEDTKLEFIELDEYTADFENIGYTTEAQRQAIQATLVAGGKIIDPKAIALTAARSRWGIDNTWNITYVYYQVDQEIFFTHHQVHRRDIRNTRHFCYSAVCCQTRPRPVHRDRRIDHQPLTEGSHNGRTA